MNGLHCFLEKEREDICISVTKTLYIYIYIYIKHVFNIYFSIFPVRFLENYWEVLEVGVDGVGAVCLVLGHFSSPHPPNDWVIKYQNMIISQVTTIPLI